MTYDNIVVHCQRHTHMRREKERTVALRWLHKLLNNWCIPKTKMFPVEAKKRKLKRCEMVYKFPFLLPYIVIVMKMASAFYAFVIPSRRLRFCSFHFLLLDVVNVSIFFSFGFASASQRTLTQSTPSSHFTQFKMLIHSNWISPHFSAGMCIIGGRTRHVPYTLRLILHFLPSIAYAHQANSRQRHAHILRFICK